MVAKQQVVEVMFVMRGRSLGCARAENENDYVALGGTCVTCRTCAGWTICKRYHEVDTPSDTFTSTVVKNMTDLKRQ